MSKWEASVHPDGETRMPVMPDTNRWLGWHFCRADGRLGHDNGRQVVVGETLTVDGPLDLGNWGLHASPSAFDALRSAWFAERLCRVELLGERVDSEDQSVARHRRCLAMLTERETAVVLRRWACWCVRQVWHRLIDEGSRRGVEVAEAWCDGKASDAELAAAHVAWSDDAAHAAWSAATARAAATVAWSAARTTQRARLEEMCLEAIGETHAA